MRLLEAEDGGIRPDVNDGGTDSGPIRRWQNAQRRPTRICVELVDGRTSAARLTSIGREALHGESAPRDQRSIRQWRPGPRTTANRAADFVRLNADWDRSGRPIRSSAARYKPEIYATGHS